MTDRHRIAGEDDVGRFEPSRSTAPAFKRVSPETIRTLRSMSGLSATVSDVLDEHGWQLVVDRDQLPLRTPPTGPVVGHAITISYLPARHNILEPAHRRTQAKLAHSSAFRVGLAGDVLVVDARGAGAISALGAIAATAALEAGFAGCVVEGGVRDIDDISRLGLPVWARSLTPRTGKWRLEAQGINAPVCCGGVQVLPGDLVVADETGICFIPLEAVDSVVSTVVEVFRQEQAQIHAVNPRR